VAKILVADDNSNIQKMVGLALRDQGIDVVAVGNGEAAVRKISDVKPDLVLADVFMPVRNGYEVCRYVKEDSSLAHIPVILLVGAFDPLDEQEAQRVGADGVLKKPFVPPDPLISMVKSALTRAGVSLGPVAPPEKPPAPQRSTADILSGNVGSKIAALAPERLPEVAPEPVEEFAAPPREQVKIAAGQEPVAFGNLLQTPEEEDVAVFSSKPMIEIAKNKEWDEETKDVPEEEEEEEAPQSGWRPGGLDELEHAGKSTQSTPDWRDQAFHGNSPARRNGAEPWSPAHEHSKLVEAAETKAVAVTTLDAKPAGAPTPFSGDAWAAAMAAGVEEKIKQHAEPVVAEPEPVAASEAAHEGSAVELPGTVGESLSAQEAVEASHVEEGKATEPANWAPVPESSWEAEAKRASMLASTWDAPAHSVPSEETQEVSAYSAEQPEVHAAAHATEETSSYSGHYEPEPIAPEPTPLIDTSAEVAVEATPSSNWGNAWETPVAAMDPAAEAVQPTIEAPQAEPSSATPETAAQPDMDELVARVLGKMNPEVLQRVTREILKPVIEAIVRDELDSKKS
jgi:CheY-like chemotaxis protein